MTRAFSALLLSLALAVTSVTLAVARAQAAGQSAGLTEVVICSGSGTVSVMLDAAGNPVDPAHHCPDCLVVLGAAHPALLAMRVTPAVLAGFSRLPVPDVAPARLVLAAAPRGPPVLS